MRDQETGLTYMQARYYDPFTAALEPVAVDGELDRFLSNDPVGFSSDMPFMFNRYAYAANDPINATDPTGMFLDTRVAIKAYPLGTYPGSDKQFGHAYVEYTDTDTGERRISRGGPSKGVSAASAISGNDSGGRIRPRIRLQTKTLMTVFPVLSRSQRLWCLSLSMKSVESLTW